MDPVEALERNLWSMWAQFGRGAGCTLVDEPPLLRFETPLRVVPYNSVMRTHLADDVADEVIDRTLARYDALGAPPVWVVHPSARPADLRDRLAARGVVEAEVVTGMVARLADLPPPPAAIEGVTVHPVRAAERDPYLDLLTWRYSLRDDARPVLGSIMDAAGFGVPGSANRAWVGLRDGVAVSKASVHLDGHTAGLYGVATHTDARGLGLARAMTLHALHDARDADVEYAVLHSTPAAVSLYLALGFERVAEFSLCARPGDLHL
jgi:GNAT superfamily N-acetyltransferase